VSETHLLYSAERQHGKMPGTRWKAANSRNNFENSNYLKNSADGCGVFSLPKIKKVRSQPAQSKTKTVSDW
jgi:hypothetical protein